MSDAGECESFMENKNKVKIEATSVNFGCIKNEPNEETQYRITLEYENIFGEPSHQRKLEDYDNLIGFLDNDVIMENAMIKLEAIKEEEDVSFNNFHCNKCKGIYKGFCLKCSTLSCILNNNSTLVNSESELSTIPTDILEIRETSTGNGVYLLRTLPINIIFGPFEGILGIESTVGHSWKLIDNKLRHIKSGNWMKDIVCASSASMKNLDIFQIDGNLYFQTNREITEGEELLIYYDDEELQQLDNSEECFYTPEKQEKLPKIFACTICCLGFGSSNCLMEHKGKCRVEQSRCMNDFVFVECYYCKMWMEKWEHEEHHVAYCLEKHYRLCDNLPNYRQTHTFEVGQRSRRSIDIDASHSTPEEIVNTVNCCKEEGKKRFHDDTMKRSHSNASENTYKYHKYFHKTNYKHNLKEHLNTHNNSEKKYKCSQCTYQTNDKGTLKRHVYTHSNIKPFECDICQNRFGQKRYLKKHIINRHLKASEKEYKCSKCSYQTNYKYHLKEHLNTHNNSAKKYKCSQCSYQTNRKGSLKCHLDTHSDIKSFECYICQNRFGQKSYLKNHIINRHLKASIKEYKCSKCSYQTNSKGTLKRHLDTDCDIKPFECDICKKRVTTKKGLNRHIRDKHSNTNEKKYKCTQCSYQTNYKSHLVQRHLNTHRIIKPFECDICKKQFSHKNSLRIHIKNQHF